MFSGGIDVVLVRWGCPEFGAGSGGNPALSVDPQLEFLQDGWIDLFFIMQKHLLNILSSQFWAVEAEKMCRLCVSLTCCTTVSSHFSPLMASFASPVWYLSVLQPPMLKRPRVTIATHENIITQLSRRCHASKATVSRENLSDIDVFLMSRTDKQGPINLRRLLTRWWRRTGRRKRHLHYQAKGLQLKQQVRSVPVKLQKPPPEGKLCFALRPNNEM